MSILNDTLPAPSAGGELLPVWAAALQRALAEHGAYVPDTPHASATALLPVLHHIQDALGFVPPALVPHIAQAFNRSRAEVHGVLTYYHHFRSSPPGAQQVQICQAEACRAVGAVALMKDAERQFECAQGSTRADGAVTLEAAYCLGLCALAPAGVCNGQLQARLNASHLAQWAQQCCPLEATEEGGAA